MGDIGMPREAGMHAGDLVSLYLHACHLHEAATRFGICDAEALEMYCRPNTRPHIDNVMKYYIKPHANEYKHAAYNYRWSAKCT